MQVVGHFAVVHRQGQGGESVEGGREERYEDGFLGEKLEG